MTYQVSFIAAPNRTFHVRYGSESALEPSYDLQVVVAALGRDYAILRADLGTQKEALGYRPDAPGWSDVLGSKLFFGFVVAIVGVTLLWMLFAMGKRAQSIPDEDGI